MGTSNSSNDRRDHPGSFRPLIRAVAVIPIIDQRESGMEPLRRFPLCKVIDSSGIVQNEIHQSTQNRQARHDSSEQWGSFIPLVWTTHCRIANQLNRNNQQRRSMAIIVGRIAVRRRLALLVGALAGTVFSATQTRLSLRLGALRDYHAYVFWGLMVEFPAP